MSEENVKQTQKTCENEESVITEEPKTENKNGERKTKSKKNAEIEALKAELEKQKELLLRTAAEFENFKRRTEKERFTVAEYARSEVLKNFLPIFDNVDRAHTFDSNSAEYAKGIEMTVKMLSDVVEKLGLQTIGEVGETFDPNLCQAVMHIEDENLGENVISQVLQKGYKIGDTVVRPAMVQVAN